MGQVIYGHGLRESKGESLTDRQTDMGKCGVNLKRIYISINYISSFFFFFLSFHPPVYQDGR